ncbi:hypothetical protein HanIR_Chr14g0702391 [Helianthus annuus]|nr:hypothetical protein HanIR_Chr14g0702391 [Helianthus annuus]
MFIFLLTNAHLVGNLSKHARHVRIPTFLGTQLFQLSTYSGSLNLCFIRPSFMLPTVNFLEPSKAHRHSSFICDLPKPFNKPTS